MLPPSTHPLSVHSSFLRRSSAARVGRSGPLVVGVVVWCSGVSGRPGQACGGILMVALPLNASLCPLFIPQWTWEVVRTTHTHTSCSVPHHHPSFSLVVLLLSLFLPSHSTRLVSQLFIRFSCRHKTRNSSPLAACSWLAQHAPGGDWLVSTLERRGCSVAGGNTDTRTSRLQEDTSSPMQ